MHHTFRNFWNDESGAVTVDWVVLTAVIVALSLVILGIFSTATTQTVADMFASILAA